MPNEWGSQLFWRVFHKLYLRMFVWFLRGVRGGHVWVSVWTHSFWLTAIEWDIKDIEQHAHTTTSNIKRAIGEYGQRRTMVIPFAPRVVQYIPAEHAFWQQTDARRTRQIEKRSNSPTPANELAKTSQSYRKMIFLFNSPRIFLGAAPNRSCLLIQYRIKYKHIYKQEYFHVKRIKIWPQSRHRPFISRDVLACVWNRAHTHVRLKTICYAIPCGVLAERRHAYWVKYIHTH